MWASFFGSPQQRLRYALSWMDIRIKVGGGVEG